MQNKRFGVNKIATYDYFMFLKKVSHQNCIYLIQNTVKKKTTIYDILLNLFNHYNMQIC